MNTKGLEQLDVIAEKVAAENGTILTQITNYDLAIRRQIQVCQMQGATTAEISAILLKYLDVDIDQQ